MELKNLAGEHPDLVLLDVNMDDANPCAVGTRSVESQ
jgi:CheY-like chemotaxis protein